jgi:hypothetical protein
MNEAEELSRLRLIANEARDLCKLRDDAIFSLLKKGVRIEVVMRVAGVDYAKVTRIRRERLAAVKRGGEN